MTKVNQQRFAKRRSSKHRPTQPGDGPGFLQGSPDRMHKAGVDELMHLSAADPPH
jgi:hypothetical protein